MAARGGARARDVGIRIGRLAPGPNDAITDVAGVRVGHVTLVSGDGPLRVGEGPVRTGVTVIVPRDGVGEHAGPPHVARGLVKRAQPRLGPVVGLSIEATPD